MGVLFEGNSLSTQLEHFDRRRGKLLRPPSVCQHVGTEEHSYRLLQRRSADCERAESQFKIDQSDGSTVGAFGHRQAQHTCGRGVGVCGATVVAAGNGPFQSILQRTEVLRNLPINTSRGIDALYVYSDVIQTKLVGNASVPLLSVVPLRGEFGQMAYKEYASPIYTPLAKHVFSTIEMYITDSAGREIPFTSGKVTVLLHFRESHD